MTGRAPRPDRQKLLEGARVGAAAALILLVRPTALSENVAQNTLSPPDTTPGGGAGRPARNVSDRQGSSRRSRSTKTQSREEHGRRCRLGMNRRRGKCRFCGTVSRFASPVLVRAGRRRALPPSRACWLLTRSRNGDRPRGKFDVLDL